MRFANLTAVYAARAQASGRARAVGQLGALLLAAGRIARAGGRGAAAVVLAGARGVGELGRQRRPGGAALLLRWIVRGEEIEEPGVCKPCEAAGPSQSSA